MRKIRVVNYMDPQMLLGRFIKIQLKGDAKPFGFKVEGIRDINAELTTILDGHDEENLNLAINLDDVDYIYGGETWTYTN